MFIHTRPCRDASLNFLESHICRREVAAAEAGAAAERGARAAAEASLSEANASLQETHRLLQESLANGPAVALVALLEEKAAAEATAGSHICFVVRIIMARIHSIQRVPYPAIHLFRRSQFLLFVARRRMLLGGRVVQRCLTVTSAAAVTMQLLKGSASATTKKSLFASLLQSFTLTFYRPRRPNKNLELRPNVMLSSCTSNNFVAAKQPYAGVTWRSGTTTANSRSGHQRVPWFSCSLH